jgi:hypothetical protein
MSPVQYSLAAAETKEIGAERTKLIQVSDFFNDPNEVVDLASAQSYAQINPHYPGIRASVNGAMLDALCSAVSELMTTKLGQKPQTWTGQAWYSIVTFAPDQLTPIQRLPHFDGFDPGQVAVMIYLNQTAHGGTAFYRHLASGFERVSEARYSDYQRLLEAGVKESGLPPARYITDGAPLFEKIAESDAAYNSMIVYSGTALHSGVIRNDVPLSDDPEHGRLTLNGFFKAST